MLHAVPERRASGAEGGGVEPERRIARGGEVEVREHPAGSPAPTERRGGVQLLPRGRDLVAGEPADPGPDRRPVPGEPEEEVVGLLPAVGLQDVPLEVLQHPAVLRIGGVDVRVSEVHGHGHPRAVPLRKLLRFELASTKHHGRDDRADDEVSREHREGDPGVRNEGPQPRRPLAGRAQDIRDDPRRVRGDEPRVHLSHEQKRPHDREDQGEEEEREDGRRNRPLQNRGEKERHANDAGDVRERVRRGETHVHRKALGDGEGGDARDPIVEEEYCPRGRKTRHELPDDDRLAAYRVREQEVPRPLLVFRAQGIRGEEDAAQDGKEGGEPRERPDERVRGRRIRGPEGGREPEDESDDQGEEDQHPEEPPTPEVLPDFVCRDDDRLAEILSRHHFEVSWICSRYSCSMAVPTGRNAVSWRPLRTIELITEAWTSGPPASRISMTPFPESAADFTPGSPVIHASSSAFSAARNAAWNAVASARFASSSSVPWRRSLPWSMRAAASHTSVTSPRRWELMKIVRPSRFRDFTMSRTSAIPRGSRPDVGSSRIRSAGSWRRPCPTASRCFIPFENVSTRLSAQPVSFTVLSTDSERAARAVFDIPRSFPAYARTSRGLRYP